MLTAIEKSLPLPTPPVSKPEFNAKSAASALKAGQDANEGQRLLQEAEQMSQEAFDEAVAIRNADIERLRDQRNDLRAVCDRADRARSFLLSGSQPSDQEAKLHERGLELMKTTGQLRARYGVYASTNTESPELDRVADSLDPEKHDEVQQLKQVELEIAEADRAIAGLPADHTPGTSAYERSYRRLTSLKEELEPRVQQIRQRFERWKEIRAIKVEADQCFAERDRLRKEREDAVIAHALK